MNLRLMRPSAAFFPAAGLLSAVFGSARLTMGVFFFVYLIELLSLCAPEAFRNAAAREVSVRRVEKRFGGAFLPLAFAVVLTCLIGRTLMGEWIDPVSLGWLAGTAGLILIEQTFEEYLFVSGKITDGTILALISNILLFTGLMLDGLGGIPAPYPCFYSFSASALGMLIALMAAQLFVRRPKLSLAPKNLGFGPRACAQVLLYPLAAGFCIAYWGMPITSALCGLILWRLSRSVCRRSFGESKSLNLLLAAAAGLLLIEAQFDPRLLPFAGAAGLALVCAELVYCAPSVRLYASTALLLSAWILQSLSPLSLIPRLALVCALSVAAVLLQLVALPPRKPANRG